MASFICIDLKSFYASVECVMRGFDPLNTHLVVADLSRTEKTICLAVSPSLKAIGVSSRPRLFEVIQTTEKHNRIRKQSTALGAFSGKSVFASELAKDPDLALDYITATPQMAKYMRVSTQIYEIYLRYVAAEDIHVYSIDEVFIDVTNYLTTYHCSAHALAIRMIRDVLLETGITATAGIGTNMYLAKIAMDIVAKKMPADQDGVRIAELDEISYRQKLWEHTPLTDFWRIGHGIANRLAANQLFTMGDIALCSHCNEELLYKLFGKNAELLIDHAWGYEPCPMRAIKSYRAKNHSLCSGQVLCEPTPWHTTRLILHEMADQLALDLVRQQLVCDQINVAIGYDHTSNLAHYDGAIVRNHYGKRLPKPVNASLNLACQTASAKAIVTAALCIFDHITNPDLLFRRLTVTANHVMPETCVQTNCERQYTLFDDVEAIERQEQLQKAAIEKEKRLQQTMLSIKERFGKNAIMKAMNYQEGATALTRNQQVGGHRA